ncbi:hypothetical protein L2249_25710, partial [Xanthomonas perforans]
PKEQVTISYLYEEPTVWNQVSWPSKSDDGLAEIVQAIPAPRPNKLVRYSSVVLSMVGLSYILYWAVRYALQSAT